MMTEQAKELGQIAYEAACPDGQWPNLLDYSKELWARAEFAVRAYALREVDELKRQLAEAEEAVKTQNSVVLSAIRARSVDKARLDRAIEALQFYKDAWTCKNKKPRLGGIGGLEWRPKESLLDDCGNQAAAALSVITATAAPGGGEKGECCHKTVMAHCDGCPYVPVERCPCIRCAIARHAPSQEASRD